ncbi:MAG: tripartite tricarboxylate transporter substrate binding protein, partial [Alphaproteobacteria bacterium]|nr:tripartite tricarboxylate transporter substrate binding protein [Alphaproteobacteria bacterium]
MRTILSLTVASGFVLSGADAFAQAYPWKPERPVTIIVPWAAGGSTDQMARIVATELEAELGQKFTVVNQPGASGSVGTKSVMDAPKDGYTWAAGAAADVGTYRVLGLLETSLQDWHLFFAVANVTAISANPGAPFKDFGQFLEVMKTRGGSVPIGTAGLSSAGHNFMESVKVNAKIDYRHVTYEGGAPAVTAAVSGEVQAVAQLLVEMSEHIKAKRLLPLAVLANQAVPLAGFGDLPPITRWLPNMPAPMNYFGIWAPRG